MTITWLKEPSFSFLRTTSLLWIVPFQYLFASERERPFIFPISVMCISWTAYAFLTTTPPATGAKATTYKQSHTSNGKFREKLTVHGREARVFRFIFLSILMCQKATILANILAGWAKWNLKALSLSNMCFLITALLNTKSSPPISVAKALSLLEFL